jgi:Flp pilus assembly protein TadD
MTEEFSRLLQEGIAAAKSGDKVLARQLLIQASELNERSEEVWLWLSGVVDDPEEARICLENVLAINPANERARQGLAWLERQAAARPAPPPPPRPAPPPPIEEQFGVPEPIPMPFEDEEDEEPQAPGNRIPCPVCAALNYDFADKCVKCGFPLTIQCANCGEVVPTETGLCPHCGADLPLPQKLSAIREREAQEESSYRQGLAYMEDGRYQEAKEIFEEILVVNPGNVEVLYNLGISCSRLGLSDEARKYWEEVQQINPEYPDIQKDLDSLLSAQDRRRIAREKKKEEARTKKKRGTDKGPASAGQSLVWEEPKTEDRPVAEEEMGGFESFLYILMVGLVIGVAYALNRPSETPGLTTERIVLILKQTGVIVLVLFVFWIVLGLLSRLLSLVFKGRGKMNGYMASSAHFLMPFFLLIIPIVLNIPLIVARLPETIRAWLEYVLVENVLGDLDLSLPWAVFGGLALLWGLFGLLRGISRVGRMAFWKGLLVGLVALAIAVVAVGGLAYFGYTTAESMGYLDLLGLGPVTITPTPTVAPVPTAVPTPLPTLAPTVAPDVVPTTAP